MYDLIAHYYDLTHNSLTADIGYLLTLAHQQQGSILELGCGTGRLMVPLLRAGYQVTGLDNSAEMLALAQLKLAQLSPATQQNAKLLLGDMCQLPSLEQRPFSLVIIPYNTLLHFDTTGIEQILRGVKSVLGENGRLFIDLINPYHIDQTPNDHALTLEAVLADPQKDETILQFASNHLDELTQTLEITWVYDATPTQGGTIHRTIAKANYHYRYPHQLQVLLKDYGYKLDKLMGDYTGAPFNEESDRLLLLAHKL